MYSASMRYPPLDKHTILGIDPYEYEQSYGEEQQQQGRGDRYAVPVPHYAYVGTYNPGTGPDILSQDSAIRRTDVHLSIPYLWEWVANSLLCSIMLVRNVSGCFSIAVGGGGFGIDPYTMASITCVVIAVVLLAFQVFIGHRKYEKYVNLRVRMHAHL